MTGGKPTVSLSYVTSAQPNFVEFGFVCVSGFQVCLTYFVNSTRKINVLQNFISLCPFEEIIVEIFQKNSVQVGLGEVLCLQLQVQGVPEPWKGFRLRIVLVSQAYSKVGCVNVLPIACAVCSTDGFPGDTKYDIVGNLPFGARHLIGACPAQVFRILH